MDATGRIVLVMAGPVTRAEGERLCAELAGRVRAAGPADAVCRVGALVRADLDAVEALARLHLTARRHGCRLVVSGASHDLRALLDLVGLGALADGRPFEDSA